MKTVGELPAATNESLCEDIMAPVEERCLEVLGKAKVGFAPTAVSLLPKVGTVTLCLARLPDGENHRHS
jgi:hypothetical protein